jgi:hypothetical protein
LHDACTVIARGYTAETATEFVNALDWLPNGLVSVQRLVAGMVKVSEDNVYVDPRVAPMLAQLGTMIGQLVSPIGEVGAAVRRAHEADLRRIEEGQGDHGRRAAWDVSRNRR